MARTRSKCRRQLNSANPLLSLTHEGLVDIAALLSAKCLSRLALACAHFNSNFILSSVYKIAHAQGRAVPQKLPVPSLRSCDRAPVGGNCWPEWFDQEDDVLNQPEPATSSLQDFGGHVYVAYAVCADGGVRGGDGGFGPPPCSLVVAIAPAGAARFHFAPHWFELPAQDQYRAMQLNPGADACIFSLDSTDALDIPQMPNGGPIQAVAGGLKFGWGQDCDYKEETEFPVGAQLTQSGDISLHSLHNDLDEGFGFPDMFVLFHRERGVDVTDANLASLDLSNMPARWVVPDTDEEAALLARRVKAQREFSDSIRGLLDEVLCNLLE